VPDGACLLRWPSLVERRPNEARELASDRDGDLGACFPPLIEASEATIEPLLRGVGYRDGATGLPLAPLSTLPTPGLCL
jgi:hypothetical protein